MTQEKKQEFGKLRSFFWPVHSFELKKVLPMALIFFCIAFNYTVLRDTKDTLIVTGSGPETIPFLKFWGTVPFAVVFMIIFSKLSNVLSKEKLFYTILTPFLIFFAFFPIFIYPNREFLHPTASADFLEATFPLLKGLVSCYRDWTYSLFYVLSELWGSAVLSLMFWGFANDIMRVTEAKRFYTILTMCANAALIVSGFMVMRFSAIRKFLPENVDAWQMSLNYLMGFVTIGGIIIMGTYWWMQRYVLTDPSCYDANDVKKKKEKTKMSLGESFKYLAQSKYLLGIALLVICYGVSINLVEILWKGEVKKVWSDPNDYNAFMGFFSLCTGAITMMMTFVGGYIIRRFGWGISAVITPIILMITSSVFFSFIIFQDSMAGLLASAGITAVMVSVGVGMIQNISSKATKYSLFDPTKEMAYIPLDQESKSKGKAAIDVVGARIGKSGGSLIQQGLLIFVPLLTGVAQSMTAIAPYLAILTTAAIGIWIYTVRFMSVEVAAKSEAKTETKPEQTIMETEPIPATS